MKKIKYLILIVCVALSSCNILELDPLDKISETTTWSDPALIELYVNATYSALPHGFNQIMWGSACDEIYSLHNWGNLNPVQRGELTSDNITGVDGKINNWNSAYSYIRNINIFFQKIDNAPGEVEFKNRVKGEMHFLRAFIYSNLIWRYGGVPIITKVFELNEDYSLERDGYDECVDYVVSELTTAISLLPAKQPANQKGRASGDACQALKARVLLYAASVQNNVSNDRAKWEKAAVATEALLNSGYTINGDYQTTFLEDNNEVIFARYFSQANASDFHLWNGRNGSGGSMGMNPTQNLVNAYEMKATGKLPYIEDEEGNLTLNPGSGYDVDNPYEGRDPRFQASILHDGSMWAGRETQTYRGGLDSPESTVAGWDASRTSYAFKKFMVESLPPKGGTIKPTNPWIFFRFAEVLLNYAEIKFELGDEATAREYLNRVRDRASVKMPPVTDSGEALRERIHNERRVELAFEEHRYFDVRRWKIAGRTEKKSLTTMLIQVKEGGGKTYTIEHLLNRDFSDQHYLLPIPRTEVEKSMNKLKQNPGYN